MKIKKEDIFTVMLDVDMIMLDVLNYEYNIVNNNHIQPDICTVYGKLNNITAEEQYSRFKTYGVSGDSDFLFNYFSSMVYNTYAKDFTDCMNLIYKLSGNKKIKMYIISNTKKEHSCYNAKMKYLKKFLSKYSGIIAYATIIFTENTGDKLKFANENEIKFDLIVDDNYNEFITDKESMLKETIFAIPKRIPWRNEYLMKLKNNPIILY